MKRANGLSVVVGLCMIGVAMHTSAQDAMETIQPLYPAAGARDVDTRKPFQFAVAARDTACEIRLGEDKDLQGNVVVRALPPGTQSADLQRDLKLGTQYYWQVVCRETSARETVRARTGILAFATAEALPVSAGPELRTPAAGAVVVAEDQQLFEWDRVEGATAYELVLVAGEKGKERDRKKEKPTTIVVSAKSAVDPPADAKTGRKPLPYWAVKLEPGKQYYWHVNALTGPEKERRLIGQLPERAFETRSDPAKVAKDAGFKLKRAFTLIGTDEKDEAATFGLNGGQGERPNYSAAFALQWASKEPVFLGGTPVASIEARLNSRGDDKKKDAVKVRLGAKHDVKWFSTDGFLSSAVKYETSREEDTKKLLAEFLYTPTIQALSVGQKFPATGFPLPDVRPVAIMWRPYLGLDVGRTLDQGTPTAETDRTLLRGVARISVQLWFETLARQLNMHGVTLFADNYYRYLPREESHQGNNYLETGLDFEFNPILSLALRYNVGRDAPAFTHERNFSVNLGLKF